MRFGGGPPPRSGWDVPNPVLGDLGRHAIDPAWRRRHRTLARGARLGGRLCRTGRPVVATVRSAERRPRDGAGLCVNAGKSGTGWLCAPTWSWPKGPPSTPTALTRCAPGQQRSQSGAQSAGQRRIASCGVRKPGSWFWPAVSCIGLRRVLVFGYGRGSGTGQTRTRAARMPTTRACPSHEPAAQQRRSGFSHSTGNPRRRTALPSLDC
jgi:hypothetical protein